MRWWPVTLLALVMVLGGGVAAMWLLGVWSPIPVGVSDPERLRLERIKTGLAAAAGVAAGMTLLMTLRRQAWSEQAQEFTQADAVEQRITALYVAAAEQLGSGKAAVRLAGLYALERLGQDNPKLRQTVVEVLCAYLRMPYVPPVEVLRGNAEGSPQYVGPDAEVPQPEEQQQQREELQVRLTAQRLLENHLQVSEWDKPEPGTYWRGADGERMNLDLVGATLVDFNLSACHTDRLDLRSAQLHGLTYFYNAVFHRLADMSEAEFYGDLDLAGAQFHEYASVGGEVLTFDEAHFYGSANLSKARFPGQAAMRRLRSARNANRTESRADGIGTASRDVDSRARGALPPS